MDNFFNRKTEEQVEDQQKDQYLIFTLGRDSYGIDIDHVTEIIGMQTVTPVPELPDYVRGIISLRGRIIPVIDVRIRFRMEQKEYGDRTCIIILELESMSVGLIVDGVSDVVSFSAEELSPPPEVSGVSSRFVKHIGRVGDAIKLILDCEKILNEEDAELLSDGEFML